MPSIYEALGKMVNVKFYTPRLGEKEVRDHTGALELGNLGHDRNNTYAILYRVIAENLRFSEYANEGDLGQRHQAKIGMCSTFPNLL